MDRLETVTQKYVLSDGKRTIEIHALQGVNHAEFLLMAYLPTEKILIHADLYSPPAPGANVAALRRNIERLKLDVAQHVPIHGRVGTHEEFVQIAR
jgi:hypothetical protein